MILAFCNNKGGTSKTSSVLNIGAALAKQGKRVLLVDLDGQCNLSDLVSRRKHSRTVYDALVERKDLPIEETEETLLSLCPASEDLVSADIELYDERKDFSSILRDLLRPIEKDFDFVLIDTPPYLSILVLNALVAADRLFVPLTAEALPTRGLKKLLDQIEKLSRRNPNLSLGGVFLTRWEGTVANKLVEETLREQYGDKILKTKVRKNTKLIESQLAGGNVLDYSPDSNGAKDYISLADEILSSL